MVRIETQQERLAWSPFDPVLKGIRSISLLAIQPYWFDFGFVYSSF
jgi:hypothetical protein